MSQNSRFLWLDIAKGITIILMVLGHTSIPNSLSYFIYAFHMPLFFIASGWVTNWDKYNVWSFIKHKLRTLMLPFFIYSIIVLLIFNKPGGVEVWLKNGWEGYALWFVPVLFLGIIIARLIMLIKSKEIQWSCIVVLLIVGCLLSYWHMTIPWTLSSVPFATFLILLGSKIKIFQHYITHPTSWMILLSIGITIIISHFSHLDMAWNHITPVIPITIGALSGTWMVFMVSVFIEKNMKLSSCILQKIGKETYIILAFSQIIIIILNEYFVLHSLIKYAILIVILVLLKYIKDGVNILVRTKIL